MVSWTIFIAILATVLPLLWKLINAPGTDADVRIVRGRPKPGERS